MLTTQRKALLLGRLSRDGRLVAAELAVEFETSEDTIRRDLRDLAADGHLTRVHGGALPASPTHRPMPDRRILHRQEKARLGRAAARLILPGQIVLMDGGTTHLALVAALPAGLRCTIVTHSPGIAAALEPFAGIEVLILGGTLMRHSMVALGSATAEGYARIRADLCFLGVTGLHPETGLTTGHAEESALKSRMIRSAAETIVLATPDKIGKASAYSIAPLSAISVLVSEGLSPDWLPAGVTHLAP